MQKNDFCYISSFSLGRKLEGLVRKFFIVVVSGLTLLSKIFQSYHDGVWLRQGRELNAHFYSAASLKYHVPDTWHDTTPSHIILTRVDQSYLYPLSLSAKRWATSTIFNKFDMSRPGIEPVTSRSPKRTLYHLSYREQ